MRFPRYNCAPLRKFSCAFFLTEPLDVDTFTSDLRRLYSRLQVYEPTDEDMAERLKPGVELILRSDQGLEIEIYDDRFTVGVKSKRIRNDFLKDISHEQERYRPGSFSDISDWNVLKRFICEAVLQKSGEWWHAQRIELECFNEIQHSSEFNSIERWLKPWNTRPLIPSFKDPDLQKAAENLTLETAWGQVSFRWEDGIMIYARFLAHSLEDSFYFIIKSVKRMERQKYGTNFADWFFDALNVLDRLRDANFVTFNALITEMAETEFGKDGLVLDADEDSAFPVGRAL